jgi:hypothetical protein
VTALAVAGVAGVVAAHYVWRWRRAQLHALEQRDGLTRAWWE